MKGLPPHMLPPAPTSQYHFTCVNCGYDVYGLRGEVLHRCPECGGGPNYLPTSRRMMLGWLLAGLCLIPLASIGVYEISWLTSEYQPLSRATRRATSMRDLEVETRCRENATSHAVLAGSAAAMLWALWGYAFVLDRTRTRQRWRSLRQELSRLRGRRGGGDPTGCCFGRRRIAAHWMVCGVVLAACVLGGSGFLLYRLGRHVVKALAAPAMTRVGSAFAGSTTNPATAAEAAKWYRRAAERGDAAAMVKLADAYSTGRGLVQSNAEAIRWYQKAVDLGDVNAMVKLGDLHAGGSGVSRDDGKAAEWYEKAAQLGDVTAMIRLGDLIAAKRVRRRPGEALYWYRRAEAFGDKAASLKVADCCVSLGRRNSTEVNEAVRRYLAAAQEGNPEAMSKLGRLYAEGTRVDTNTTEALAWYKKAAALGDAAGMIGLAEMYAAGRGVAKDDAETAKWYERAAAQGDVEAMIQIGMMYFEGRGVAKDNAAAATWLRKAAAKGSSSAPELLRTLDLR